MNPRLFVPAVLLLFLAGVSALADDCAITGVGGEQSDSRVSPPGWMGSGIGRTSRG
jgi:hypothetical protein